jgi:iron complex outermembrane recepter protein
VEINKLTKLAIHHECLQMGNFFSLSYIKKMKSFPRYSAIALGILTLTSQQSLAEETKALSSIVVTATKLEQDAFDLPMSINKVDKQDIQDGQLRMTLSESLARVPGLTAQNRNQMAQDPQISSRGFGARSSFGVRGIRIYVDGIPLSLPDGIGNPGSVDLGIVDSIEVMRGPFSAMYGNSSGGVIQMLTGKPGTEPTVSLDVLGGTYGTRRQSLETAGNQKGIDYQINVSDFASDGYRKQSASDKKQATAKLGVKFSEDTKLTTLMNWFDQNANDPGGSVRTSTSSREPSAFTSPREVATSFLPTQANTRVSRSNTQIGLNLEHKIDGSNLLNVIAYAGTRTNAQYLSISGLNSNGRLSSIDRSYSGTELKYANKGMLLSKPYNVTYGLAYGQMEDKRLDEPATGGVITGAIANRTRDEKQSANNFDQYIQGMWSFADQWDLHAGLRRTNLKLKIEDNPGVPVAGNTDLTFAKATPVLGLVYKLSPTLNIYGNAGRGFETPTLTEITYIDPTNAALGPRKYFLPSKSSNFEVGTKWFPHDAAVINAAFFRVNTNNEIVTEKLQGSTGSFKNAGATKREGIELSAQSSLPYGLSAVVAHTVLSATFESPFTTPAGKTVKAGNAHSWHLSSANLCRASLEI